MIRFCLFCSAQFSLNDLTCYCHCAVHDLMHHHRCLAVHQSVHRQSGPQRHWSALFHLSVHEHAPFTISASIVVFAVHQSVHRQSGPQRHRSALFQLPVHEHAPLTISASIVVFAVYQCVHQSSGPQRHQPSHALKHPQLFKDQIPTRHPQRVYRTVCPERYCFGTVRTCVLVWVC
jgi:hypothetical protein